MVSGHSQARTQVVGITKEKRVWRRNGAQDVTIPRKTAALSQVRTQQVEVEPFGVLDPVKPEVPIVLSSEDTFGRTIHVQLTEEELTKQRESVVSVEEKIKELQAYRSGLLEIISDQEYLKTRLERLQNPTVIQSAGEIKVEPLEVPLAVTPKRKPGQRGPDKKPRKARVYK